MFYKTIPAKAGIQPPFPVSLFRKEGLRACPVLDTGEILPSVILKEHIRFAQYKLRD
jgi:hypothetical protein